MYMLMQEQRVVNTSIAVCIMSHFGTLIPPGSWYRQRGSKYCLHDWQMPLQVNRGAKRLRSRARQPLPPPPPHLQIHEMPRQLPAYWHPRMAPSRRLQQPPSGPSHGKGGHHGLLPASPWPAPYPNPTLPSPHIAMASAIALLAAAAMAFSDALGR